MALTSPGVQVSVVDESFYTPAEPGTVPVIFVASAENKTNASGSGTAVGTLKTNGFLQISLGDRIHDQHRRYSFRGGLLVETHLS